MKHLRAFFCRLGMHAGGHTVTGWGEDGVCYIGWRCSACWRVLHVDALRFVGPISPDRVPRQRELARQNDGPFYWEPPVSTPPVGEQDT